MPDPRLDTYSADPTLIVYFNTAAGAAAGDYEGRFFIAPFPCEVIEVREQHRVAGSSTTASVNVLKVPSGTAAASGTAVIAAVMDVSTVADTVKIPALHATLANRRLAESDSLALVGAGTLTAVDGLTVQVVLRVR
jgi:hypothetical protein